LSLKTVAKLPTSLEIASGCMGPQDKDVMSQLNISHPLQLSEMKVSTKKIIHHQKQ
jgi:hypothetical protein